MIGVNVQSRCLSRLSAKGSLRCHKMVVIETKVKNTSIRIKFYNIPCIRNQVAFRQLSYVGKIFRREGTHLPTRLLTAWCDHPRKRGRPLLTNKMSLARNLRLIIPEVDEGGALSSWGFHALDTGHWHDLLATLKHPANTTPDGPPDMSAGDADTSPPLECRVVSPSTSPASTTLATPATSSTTSSSSHTACSFSIRQSPSLSPSE